MDADHNLFSGQWWRRRGRKGGWCSVDEAGGCGIGWRAKRGVGRVTSKGATLARTRTRSHVWALDQVGECLSRCSLDSHNRYVATADFAAAQPLA
eukprot:scaffold2131_cov113-Isochrysis_galbana.AAC.15